ncbi:hypothetical protein [Saccharothrix deserti]|uniref:hypothetical protein n=1 Tax=Saccharothrix deserti TaxID=2593674 RepID=UPI00131B587E|nr:hypothetical protein [Saccharothrix deserti]
MSETTGASPRTSLYDHAVRLHRQHPDGPLPRDGRPLPDEPRPRRRRPEADQRLVGADVAEALDRHFGGDAPPQALAEAVRDLYVPMHRNDHIAAAALRWDRERVRTTGRWLVRHGTDRQAVAVGLALLASGWDEDDIPLIRTIGLLSDSFGPLAAEALKRRRGGADALLWLGDRVAGWGRVYVVEALCLVGGRAARDWLLRRACDGDFLNGYYAGKVATAAHLHEAITAKSDDDLVDHTGRLLLTMADCGGMGMTLEHYPPAHAVVGAHVGHLDRQQPTLRRYLVAATIAHRLGTMEVATAERRARLVDRYRAVLDRDEWCAVVREASEDPDDHYLPWFRREIAPKLGLRAFEGLTTADEG